VYTEILTTSKNKVLLWGVICVVVVLAAFLVQPHQAPTPTPISDINNQQQGPAQLSESGDDTNGTHLGRIASIGKNEGNAYMLTINYAHMTDCASEGADACPNDFRIVADNADTRSFYLNHDAPVLVQTYPFNSVMPPAYNREIALDDFITLFTAPDQSTYPAKSLYYWITIEDGVVTSITEQYQP
jgi:hypothetical protein